MDNSAWNIEEVQSLNWLVKYSNHGSFSIARDRVHSKSITKNWLKPKYYLRLLLGFPWKFRETNLRTNLIVSEDIEIFSLWKHYEWKGTGLEGKQYIHRDNI